MANKLLIKRGNGAPNNASIDNYELVYNYTNNELWTKHNGSVVKVSSGANGTVTNVVAGNGLSGGGTVTATLDLDFSELTDMTGDISGTTEFILQNGTTESRKAASEIKLSYFNNDSNWTSNAGTVTSIATGTGLTGGTITGSGTISLTNHSGDLITSGTVAAARIANLPASKITSGAFDIDRIPTAAVTNGDINNVPTADNVYDFVTGQGYLTSVPNHSASLITSGTLNNARLNTDMQLSSAAPRYKLQETGVTNTPVWWMIADGGNYSIRLNNTGTYPLTITTNGENTAVSSITLGYNTSITGSLETNNRITSTATGGFTIGNYAGRDRIQNTSNSFSFLTDANGYANMEFGTVTAGTWQGTAIANAYVADLPASKITSGELATARVNWDSTDKTVRWDSGRGYHGNPRSMAIGYSGGNYGQFGYNIGFTTTSNQHTYAFNDIATRCDLFDGLQVYTSVSGGTAGTQISWTELMTLRNGEFSYKQNTIWHQGNDGSGSGLDADLLDGNHASAFLTTSGTAANSTLLNNLGSGSFFRSDATSGTITSQDWNTYIDGTEAHFHSVTNHSGSNRPTGAYTYGVALSYSAASQGKFQLYAPETATSGTSTNQGLWYRSGWNTTYRQWARIWDSTNDGSGSGLDADLLDGVQASGFTRAGVESGTPNTAANKTTFTCNDAINTSSGNQSGLQVWQDTAGADAFMTFHVAGDYAVYFGLDGGTNDLAVGGWSRGANSYKVWHQGNDGSGSTLDADLLDGLQGSSYWTKSGSWVGDLGSNGYTRVQGVSNGGGEFVLALKSGQLHTLVDGSYIAYEASSTTGGGFWSSYNSSYGNASGFKASANDKIRVQQLDGGTADLEVTGNIKLTNEKGLLWDYTPGTGVGGYIAHPGGGMYRTSSGAHTGAIAITLPSGGGPADMVSFWVDVFDYTSYESQSFFIAGYVYQTAGSNEWVNETAMMLTPKENHARTVRFGHNGTNHVVYIGELADTWSYPQVTVRNVQVGYASDVDTYDDNWDISFEASAFANVDATYSGADTLLSAGKIKMADGAGKFVHNTTSSRDKIRVWNSSVYAIGMQSGFTFGGLENQYAMTFQMNNQSSERGFWWGDDGHGQGNGAMALTTAGELTVADSIRVGYGESDTTTPGASYALDVSGNSLFDGNLWIDKKIHTFTTGTGHVASFENNNTYLMLRNPQGNTCIFMGGTGDSNNYYDNGSHRFRSLGGGTYFAAINSTGLRIGTGGSFASYRLDVIGDARISSGSLGVGVNPNATDGRGDFSNDVVAYSTSDKRLKENIKPLDNALDKVMKISGVEFDWKPLTKEEKKTIHGNEGHDVGVIAQEIEEVLPEVVTTRDTGYKAVKYEKIVPLLIESIKELKEEINGLKTKLGE